MKLLVAEVGKPRYGSYHVYLTNLLPKASVKQLAEADMQEVVKEVKEIYIDYLPIGNSCLISCSLVFLSHFRIIYYRHPPLWTLLAAPSPTFGKSVSFQQRSFPLFFTRWVEESLQRTSQALASLLLSLRLSPTIRLAHFKIYKVSKSCFQVPGRLRASQLARTEPALHDG